MIAYVVISNVQLRRDESLVTLSAFECYPCGDRALDRQRLAIDGPRFDWSMDVDVIFGLN